MTGIISWLLIKAGDWGFSFLTPQLLDLATTHPPILMGFLASFYGGIVEEVTLRFFLMALFLWPLKKYGSVGVWVAILLAAVVFGIGHLPATVQVLGLHSMVDLPILVVSRALILNGIVGVICGWLYWRKGLEYAIISHFTADLGVHILSPLLG
ncbi:MAG: CPBP family intramembrane metalloprotease [Alphaproteobacteria bacterium]|nr:CPBP family intramembrane metalloprotease [Alphaproteobacteria bacterium]